MSHDLAAAVGAAAFWLFIAIIVVAAVFNSTLRHRETQKTIRQAMERGQALDPETLDRLIRSDKPPPPSRTAVVAGGIMLLAVGGGLALIGWFGARSNPVMLDQGLGAGSLVGLLGIGLIVVSLFIPRGNGRR
jgi:hypothetical protein